MPSVQIIESDQETILRLAYPSEQLLIASDGKHMNYLTHIADGVSTQFNLPYVWGKDECQ